MSEVSVFICDDHQIVIDGLTLVINEIEGFNVSGSGTNGHEAILWLRENNVDVVLMDINMPIMDGIKACQAITLEFPKVHVIYLSMHNQIDIIHTILESGAKGYLLKNSGKKIVETAIRKVMLGENYFDEKIFRLKAKTQNDKPKKTLPKVTKREKEVLALIVKEYTSIEIAKALFISTGTVDTHRRNLISKLDVKNTAGLVRVAIEYKLL